MGSWKKFIMGEKMPDKDDPQYKERYEKDVDAGRRLSMPEEGLQDGAVWTGLQPMCRTSPTSTPRPSLPSCSALSSSVSA